MGEDLALTPEETKTLRDFLNLGRALTGSLTSEQIITLSSRLEQLLPLLQTFSDPDVQKLIKILAESAGTLVELILLMDLYHKSGTIKSALELVAAVGAVKNALNSQTISHWAETANNWAVIADQAAAEFGGVEGIGERMKSAREAAQDTRTIGVIGLLKALKEPQIQKGIKFLLHLARSLDR